MSPRRQREADPSRAGRSLRAGLGGQRGGSAGAAGGAMDGAAAFGMDKPFGPGPARVLELPDTPQGRKNFSVSRLLDLEEVAAGMNGAKEPGAEPRDGAKGAQDPSGGSSGSEAAPQDSEYRRAAPPSSQARGHPRSRRRP